MFSISEKEGWRWSVSCSQNDEEGTPTHCLQMCSLVSAINEIGKSQFTTCPRAFLVRASCFTSSSLVPARCLCVNIRKRCSHVGSFPRVPPSGGRNALLRSTDSRGAMGARHAGLALFVDRQ